MAGMNDRHIDQLLQEWLDLGPSVAPDHVHDAVIPNARATRQAAPNWSGWVAARIPPMTAITRLACAGAVIALVAIVGINLLMPSQAPRPGSGPSTSATPSPQATPRPRPSSSQLETRTVNVDGIQFSFDLVRSGWEHYRSFLIAKSEEGPQGAEAIVYWSRYPETPGVIACGPWSNSPETSVDYLANAMATAPGVEVVEPISDVTIDGQAAKHMVVIVRENLGCDPGYFFNWRAQSGGALWQMTVVGDTLSVWIFDMRPTPFIVVAETNSEASDWLKDEVRQIVESIRFE
jgi:hypothetical protein